MAERDSGDHGEPTGWWERSEVKIEEFGGIKVAHHPERDEAWISGWVDVPR